MGTDDWEVRLWARENNEEDNVKAFLIEDEEGNEYALARISLGCWRVEIIGKPGTLAAHIAQLSSMLYALRFQPKK